jgi:hypothetical protein
VGGRLIGVFVVLAAAMAVLPSAASAYSSVSVSQEKWADKQDGFDAAYDSHDYDIQVSGDTTRAVVSVWTKAENDEPFDLTLEAPLGEKLQAGKTYAAADTPYRVEGFADMSTSAAGCITGNGGSFEITDLATGPDGKITRLRVVYVHHCGKVPPSTFGEVRYGFPEPDPAAASPSILKFPFKEKDAAPVPRPVTIRAGSAPVHFSKHELTGADAASYAVTSDGCSGTTLPAGGTCQVHVQFAPTQPGQRSASLRLVRDGGHSTTVPLSGYGYGGTTGYSLDVQPDDPKFPDMHYTAANARFFADGPQPYDSGTRENNPIAVGSDDGDIPLSGLFFPPKGETLQTGRTYTFDQDTQPLSEGGPGFILAWGQPCPETSGWFRFNERKLDAANDARTIDVSFVGHCGGDHPETFTGHFQRRAGDTTPPAAWMLPGADTEWGPWTSDDDTSQVSDAGAGDAASAPGTAHASSAPAVTHHSAAVPSLSLSSADRAGCASMARHLPKARTGTAAADHLGGTRHADVIVAGGGRDRVAAGAGDDCVSGGPGADRIDGGPGHDVLMGDAGDDVLVGGPGPDLLLCGPGHDMAYAGPNDRTRGCEKVHHAKS